jgi:ABC-2 type transport system permease protein
MIAIARSEFVMLIRNRTVLISSVLLPLAFGAYFVFSGSQSGSAGYAAACVVVGLAAMGTYAVATTTLSARRQTHFLKRLRSSAVSDTSILLGVTVPVVVLNCVQTIVILLALGFATGQPLLHPWALVLAVVLSQIMFAAFALATAGVTGSPESAQYTCLPLLLGSIVVAAWALMSQNELARWLPGGGLAVLAEASWSSPTIGSFVWLVGPTLLWAAGAVAIAKLLFRWDSRS